MARLLQSGIDPLERCSYLPGQDAALANRLMLDVTPEEFEPLLERGWRRFGPSYFRPACAACQECVPIRIPVDRFSPDRSQRRATKKCATLRQEVAVPCVDDARLELYHRWHRSREAARGWRQSFLDEQLYSLEFAFPHPCARELSFWDGERLVGVAICDETPRAWSAVYFYYDPVYAERSIGVANVCAQVELARSRGRKHVYLGFRVAGCRSMAYKARFRPHELLVGRPAPDEAPQWVEAT